MGTQVRLGGRYRAWAATTTVSEAVDDAVYFALAWAASAHGGPAAGLVLAAVSAPRVVLTLVGGAVTDRAGPRAVVVATVATLAIASALTALLVGVAGTPLALLAGFAALVGVATSFLFPATNTLVARAVEAPALARAMSLRQLGYQVADLTGRPLGGLLVGIGGLALALWVNAATFLAVLGVVVLLRLRRHVPSARVGSLFGEIVDGVRTAWAEPSLRTVLALYALAAGSALPVGSLLVPLLARDHGWTVGVTGLVAGAIGLGATVVALVVARTGAHPRTAVAVATGLATCGVGALLLAFAPNAWLAAAGGAVHGAGLAVFIAHAGPLVVAGSPDTHLGRVQAVLGVVQSVTMFLLPPVFGAVAGIADARIAAVLAAALLLAGAVAAALTRHLVALGAKSTVPRSG